jgi:hypothetical protein
MIRWSVIVACLALVAGAAFVAGSSIPPKPPGKLPDSQNVKAVATLGQHTGYFNIARLMSEYQGAQSAVARLNMQKDRMSANLTGLRAMHDDLLHRPHPAPVQQNGPPGMKLEVKPDGTVQTVREGPGPFSPDAILLYRRIQDLELEINKLTNNQATKIIVEVHDELRATVAELARDHNLVAVLAFPDTRTPEELNNPMIKELKLKPQAAHPFYLDSAVDYTDELLERLNAKSAHNGRK